MKNWIAMFAVCSAASGAFAEVVSLIPGQRVVVPASAPGSVPVVIEAGLLKQTSQLSFLPDYDCQGYTTSQIANDPNWVVSCDGAGMTGMLFYLQRPSNGTLRANKPASLQNTRITYLNDDPGYQYPYRSDINGGWSGIRIDLSTGSPTEVTTLVDYTITTTPTPSFSTGGIYREKSVRLSATDLKVYSDVDGTSTATKTRSATNYKQVSFPVWTFDSWVGPALPVSRLASTQNVIARTQYLTGAGFKVTDLGDGTLYAVGTYKTLNMRMTTEGQALFSNSLGSLWTYRNALKIFNSGVANYYNPMSFSANIGYFIN